MLLAIDIGNTNISFGVFRGRRIIKRFNIPKREYSMRRLKQLLGRSRLKGCIICSVVPKALRKLNSDLTKFLGSRPFVLGREEKVPIKNLYKKPHEVGQDRLVNAYAGIIYYGAPLIIVDFGTAITFDVVSMRKEYIGGMIVPGLSVSLDALTRTAALLPKIKLEKPKGFIGKDTKSSMISGIIYGFAALVDDLTRRLKNKIGGKARVIATGGNACLVLGYCKTIDKTDKNLTLKGL
ncbi:MAG: type III pantothenate kinase, partial [Candidatus Omnitrophica bacterium]|nr:type III pantothenate kinase [Candidatus Omnitrophota bacterium]